MANPRKRQRTPDNLVDPSDSPTELRRDDEFWFSDGSIVLATGTAAFRVHSGVLALRSQVFRDMLAVGQSTAEGQELMDGCPVVRLSDEAEELYELVKVIYYPESLRRGTDIEFPLILRLLRLSRKYDVEFIRKELIAHLRLLFPSTLEGFEEKWEDLEPPFGDIHDELMAVQAGVIYDIPEILPAAYYLCCQQPVTALLKGGIFNGTMAERIPTDQLDKILIGRERLLHLKRNTLRKDKGIGYNVVLPLLQLSRKYEIDFIREEVIQFLHLEFPSSLAKFERTYYEKPTDAPPWDSIDRELIALRAGLTFGIPEILPAAYYFCCQLPLASLFKLKIDVSDGTDQPIPADQSKTDTCSDKDGAIPEDEPKNDVPDDMDKSIPADHLKTILLGREKLLRLKRTFVDDFVAKYLDVEVCLHCPHLKDVCLRFLSEDAGEKYDNDLSFFFGGNEVADRFTVAASKWNVCSRCLNERRAAEVNGRKTAWEKLPSCFGLQEWSEVGKALQSLVVPQNQLMANPRKRPRSKAPADESTELERSGDFWFDDGSIVIVAGSIAFRVHSSVLALHSQVFRDMLAVGQSTEGQETMDGCPVVQLSDEYKDLYELLTVLYHPNTLRKDKGINYDLILPLLQLSRKYDIEFIRREIVQYLRMEFPSSLYDFEQRYREETLTWPPWSIIDDSDRVALQAGLVYDIPEILPAAYYFCCQVSLENLLEHDVSGSGDDGRNGDLSKISRDQLNTILLGREKLLRLKRKYIDNFVDEGLIGETRSHCAGIKDLCLKFLSEDAGAKYDHDLAFFFGGDRATNRFKAAAAHWNICNKCLKERRIAAADGRKWAWSMLPSCFGFKGWPEVDNNINT
ncbi:hypothetical protein EWM64_g3962 [Hericium alpestre]|uniref:BTB domain-containing protein n=1 Tax=Hericium alpestre TaxID=135208 RepID=A0A4Z0A006_9AGAM|nr:hypothetical protein EWM64_g3962 [Hericium alpestre]